MQSFVVLFIIEIFKYKLAGTAHAAWCKVMLPLRDEYEPCIYLTWYLFSTFVLSLQPCLGEKGECFVAEVYCNFYLYRYEKGRMCLDFFIGCFQFDLSALVFNMNICFTTFRRCCITLKVQHLGVRALI